MYILQNWYYTIDSRYYRKLSGKCSERMPGQFVTSCPVKFDEVNRIVTTKSGTQYQLGKCAIADEVEQLQFIRDDVKRGYSLDMLPLIG